jgi:hypothetical protein
MPGPAIVFADPQDTKHYHPGRTPRQVRNLLSNYAAEFQGARRTREVYALAAGSITFDPTYHNFGGFNLE